MRIKQEGEDRETREDLIQKTLRVEERVHERTSKSRSDRRIKREEAGRLNKMEREENRERSVMK